MDPYNCICEYIWSMRRLLTWIQSQNHCTDTECFTEHPGYEGSSGDSSGMFQLGLILVLWIVIAILLFIFRPNSLRGSGDSKPPSLPHSDNDRKPTPPAE